MAAAVYEFKAGDGSSHSLLLAAMPPSGAGARVLDVGCADGYLAERLAQRGYRVLGVDTRPPRELRGFTFAVADLDDGLPDTGEEFDHFLLADVLEHLKAPERLLEAIHGAAAPGAVLYASLPNSGNIYFRLNVLLGRFPAHDRGLFDRTHLHFYMWDGWLRLFSGTGWRIETRAASGIPFTLALGAGIAGRALERIGSFFARLWPCMFAYQFIVTARSTQ